MSTPTPPPTNHSLSLPWRFSSSLIMGLTGSISRGFLYGLNKTEVVGLDRFLELLDQRKDVEGRNRGLVTVSNHVSVFLCSFFSYGQVLPTHRGTYSPPSQAGLFQSTMTQAIRLLSSQPFAKTLTTETSPSISDPFSGGSLTYSTTGADLFSAPSVYPSRRHSWVHIFPEGRVHQHPTKSLRYFKWGVSRLILESDPLPEIVPIFIDGNQQIMHESREWPRFVPRIGKDIKIAFGEKVDGEKVFGELRERWRKLVQMQKEALVKKGLSADLEMGELTEGLKYGTEAVALRKEVTLRIRREVLKVRKDLGYPGKDDLNSVYFQFCMFLESCECFTAPEILLCSLNTANSSILDEDPKQGLVETWIEEGGKQKGKMPDGSWVGDT
ncbi:Lysophosphatidylcholine acyltransferase [Lachnellula suecica]|uniref:Tafazzin family protein n=1 Tax=Lachnellula suecica TaxID=602035 RepID=A0A8T9BSQ5_9HELO|nr:Lysophosphatidylcholine acyltransferase [Lachnellula suecica]